MICNNDQENEVAATLNLPLSYDCIWVADDNPEVRLLLERAFKRIFPPVPVEYFSDGAGILERIRRGDRAPRLLLLDLQMPSLNGIETLKRLNEEGATYETTVLMFSTCAGEEEVLDAYELGAQFFLQKPIGGEEYRELAKLCLRCLDLPVPTIGSPIRSRALDVTAALVAVESVSENAEMEFLKSSVSHGFADAIEPKTTYRTGALALACFWSRTENRDAPGAWASVTG